MRMSDWSSDVCSSDLVGDLEEQAVEGVELEVVEHLVEGGDVEVEAATIIFGADFERIDILRLEDQILEARRHQDGPDAAGAPGERRPVEVAADRLVAAPVPTTGPQPAVQPNARPGGAPKRA